MLFQPKGRKNVACGNKNITDTSPNRLRKSQYISSANQDLQNVYLAIKI